MKMNFIPWVVSMCLLAVSSAFTQIPRDNPYRTFYTKYPKPYNPLPPVGQHWTDNLPWDKVYDVTQDLTKSPFNMSQNAIKVPEGTVPSAANNNIPIINEAINRLSAAGGGVLFFPAGTYCFGIESTDPNNFYDNRGNNGERYLQLKEGVILRGATPIQDVAKSENSSQSATYTNIYNTSQVFTLPFRKGTFAPPTKFVFPKYHPVLSGGGMPNRSAFMKIISPNFDDNLGLCYIDINRAGIYISPYLSGSAESKTNHRALVSFPDHKQNILVFGLRVNNHLDPQDEDHLWGPFLDAPASQVVPRASVGHQLWQRWAFRLAAHIDVEATGNVVVANNRIGDIGGMNENEIPDDSYPQPGFFCNFNSVARQVPDQVSATFFSGSLPSFPNNYINHAFEYSSQIGIRLNRKKPVGADASGPAQEPYWYYEGNEILDNWVYNTSLPSIMGSGTGLNVSGNVRRDNFYKPVGGIQRTGAAYTMSGFSSTLGKWQTGNAADYQERGIDISGYDVKVTYNDVMTVPTRGTNNSLLLGKVGSILVEGDIIRNIRNYDISNNTVNGSIQVQALRNNINGMIVRNNTVKSYWYDYPTTAPAAIRSAEVQPFILVSADGAANNENLARLENADVSGNTLIGDPTAPARSSTITVRGSLGGFNCKISGNNSVNAGKINDRVPCYCKLNNNPDSGFAFNDNTNLPVLNSSNNSNPIVTGQPTGRRLCVSGPIAISGFSPSCARAGDRIFITGNNLSSLFAVNFGTVTERNVEIINDNTAAVVVPTGVSSGLQPVTAIADGGTLGVRVGQNPDPIDNRSASASNFNVNATALAAPTVSEVDVQEGGSTLKRITMNVSSGKLYWTADGSTPNEFSNTDNVVLAIDTLVINAKAFDANATGCLRESGISQFKIVPTIPLNARVQGSATPWKDNKEAAASLSFEGNDDTFFDNATLSTLTNAGIKASFFLVPSASNTQTVKNQLRSTHEIGATSTFNLALTSNINDSVLTELQSAQSLLDSPAFYAWLSTPPVLHQEIASSVGFKGSKTFARSQTGYYPYTNTDFYAVTSIPVDTQTTATTFTRAIDAAIAGNGWVAASIRLPISSGNVEPVVYDSVVNILSANKNRVWVAPFGEIHRYHRQFHNLRVAILDTLNGISLRIEDYLDASYEDSVTLKVNVAQGVCLLSVTQGGQNVRFSEVTELVGGQPTRYVIFNAKPDASLLIRVNYSSAVPSVSLTRLTSANACNDAVLRVGVAGGIKATDSIFVSLNGGSFNYVKNDSVFTFTERTNVQAFLKSDAGSGCGFINGLTSSVVVKPKLCAPTITPATGFYIDSVAVSIANRNSLPPGTVIRYAFNEASVSESSPILEDNQVVFRSSGSLTVRGFNPDYDSSEIVQANYAIESRRAIEPQVVKDTSNIIIADFVSGDSVYYTTDGSVPTNLATRLTSSSLPLVTNGMYRFIRYATASRPSVVVNVQLGSNHLRPMFSPRAGAYSGSQSITITAPTSTDTIYYTTDGTEPSIFSMRIIGNGIINISSSVVVKASVFKNGIMGETVSSSYIINGGSIPKLLKPTIQSSINTNAQTVITISQVGTTADSLVQPARRLYYTTDGTIPSADTLSTTSKLYNAPFILASGRGSVIVKAIGDNFIASDTAVLMITTPQSVHLAVPTLNIVDLGASKIISFDSIRSSSGNATAAFLTGSIARIFYTTDGSEPTTASKSFVFGSSGVFRDTLTSSALVRFRAIPLFELAGFAPSPMDSVSVMVNSVAVQTLPQPQLVTVSKSVTGLPYDVARLDLNGLDTTLANVWYTTDGSEPSPALGNGKILRADSIPLTRTSNNIKLIAYPKTGVSGFRPSALNDTVVSATVDSISVSFVRVSDNQTLSGATATVTRNETIRVIATTGASMPSVNLFYRVGNTITPISGNEVVITCQGAIRVVAAATGAQEVNTIFTVRLVDTMLAQMRVSNFVTSALGTVTEGTPVSLFQNGAVSITGNQYLTVVGLPSGRTLKYRFAGDATYTDFTDTLKLRSNRNVETELSDVCYSEPSYSTLTVNYNALPSFKLLYRIGANAIYSGGEVGDLNIPTNGRATMRIIASPDGNKTNPNFIAGLRVAYTVRDRLTGSIIADTTGTERDFSCVARIVVSNAFVPLGKRDTLYADLSDQNGVFDINNTYPIMSEATVNLGGVTLLPTRTNAIRSTSDNTIQMYITFANRRIDERVVDKLYYAINGGAPQLYTPSTTTTLIRTDVTSIRSLTVSAEDACYSVLPNIVYNTAVTVSGLQVEDISDKVVVYPNPASQRVRVSVDAPETGKLTISLKNMTGATLKLSSFEKVTEMAEYETTLADVAPGVYILELTIGNKRSIKKLVVQ